MALHKIKLQHPDGTTATFFENKDGTWDYSLHNGETLNWFNSLSAQIMIATVCAASDCGAEIKVEKCEDKDITHTILSFLNSTGSVRCSDCVHLHKCWSEQTCLTDEVQQLRDCEYYKERK